MHVIEWVSLYEATERLQTYWGIPLPLAEELVRNVVHGGRVEVRATRGYQLIPQIVTGQIQLSQAVLLAADYENIEIDWNGLLEEGRKLLPSWTHVQQYPAIKKGPRPKRDQATQAIKDLWPDGAPNQKDLSDGELCEMVSDKIADRRKQQGLKPIAPLSDDTILRAAGRRR
jgi:hypothetical protein